MRFAFIARNDLDGLEEDAAFAAAEGITGLEFNFWGPFRELEEDTVKRMRAILDRHGVRAAMLGIWGFNHLDHDPDTRAEARGQLERAIGFAGILGAELLVTGGGQVHGEPLGRQVKDFAAFFPAVIERVQAAGMRMAFYPVHGASFFDGLSAYEAVWAEVPEVMIKFDPANWHHHGDDYLEPLIRYGRKIGHVHVKEHLYHGGKLVSQPPAGMGDVRWGPIMALLHEANYDGWLSMEPHGPIWSKAPRMHDMVRLSKRHLEQFLV